MNKLKIDREWPSTIAQEHINLPEEMRITLIDIIKKQDQVFTEDTYNKQIGITKDTELFERKIYNIFDCSRYSDENEVKQVKGFEKLMSSVIRDYIHKAWDADKNVEIKVRGFGNVQKTFGRRTAPHFHHGWDGVLAHYLTVGEEFDLKEQNVHKPFDTDWSGKFILLDPRPKNDFYGRHAWKCARYQEITPTKGLTIIHPGYLWHETNTHTKAGVRVLVAISFTILTRNHSELPTTLDNPDRHS